MSETKAPATEPKAKGRVDKVNRAVEAAHRFDNDQTIIVRGVALVSRILARLFARVRIEGMEHVPRSGPVILAVNHI